MNKDKIKTRLLKSVFCKKVGGLVNYLQKITSSKKYLAKIFSDLSPENQKIIYLSHEWGGGVELYLQDKIEQQKNNSYIFVIIYKKKLEKINLQIIFKEQFASALLNDFAELLDIFGKIKIDIININQISFFPNIDVVFDFIKKSKGDHTKVFMLMHDFSSICRNNHLIKNDGSECGIICDRNYCECNSSAGENVKKWGDFLTYQTDQIICFSEHSKKIIGQIYPAIANKIANIPHQVPYLRRVNVEKKSQIINIATIGFLNKIKGCEMVEEMSKIIVKDNLPVKIKAIGKCKVKSNDALKIFGKYDRDDLPEIIENNEVDIIFISSICPETFSYTTHEAMMMGMKVACFDLGAQAEYIGKYDKGLIISQMNAKTALDEILEFVKQKNNADKNS